MKALLIGGLLAALLVASHPAGASDAPDRGLQKGPFVATIGSPAPWSFPLMPSFKTAAKKYKIPLPLLLTLGYFGSAFENRGDTPTIEGGYGVMALRENILGGNSLQLGAKFTGVSPEALKIDPAANIEAAAAVLALWADEIGINRAAGIQAWLNPVIKYAALDQENSRFFAMEVYRTLRDGLSITSSSGETFSFGPQDIGSVDLASLIPSSATIVNGMVVPAGVATAAVDYPLAIWDQAATCNYSTAQHSSDTVVVHTVEGTAAGCRSWFKMCDHGTLGPSSSNYVVDSAGTVWQMVRENDTAWHAGCYNYRSAGIEHEGYAASASHPKALYDGSAALTRDICNRWGIPKEKRTVGPGIIGHVDVTNCCCGTHTDPGNGWDWNYYIAQVVGTPPADQVYVESRSPGRNHTWYSDSSWADSVGWCNDFDNNLIAGASRYLSSGGLQWCQVQPTLGVPGGTYRVEVSHYGTLNISSDITASVSLTNCTGISGNTTAFQSGQSCQWVNIGQITLNPGQTQPTVRFNLTGGTINGTHRWNTEGFRFTLVGSPLVVNACAGGTVGSGGSYAIGQPVTVTATPNPGYCFVNWTTDACGGGAVVSRSPNYAFNMPPNSLTLYANFAKGLLYEGYEGFAVGDVDMNNGSGPNKAANGDKNSGNPWSGPSPPNGSVVKSPDGGVNAHGGSMMLTAPSGYANCVDMLNAAYRFNSGIAFSGGIYLDWWFYDPKGGAADANTYQDYAALCYYNIGIMPADTDYGIYPSPFSGASQRLSLGASQNAYGGYDKTKYQARVVGASGGYDQGWFNTSVPRSVGWHHGRIVVGGAKGGTNTNDVSFYIDDMTNAAFLRDSSTSVGYNSIQVNTRPSSSANTAGYFDDIRFGKIPTAPDFAAVSGIGVNQITWNWVDNSGDEDGFNVWDSLGALRTSRAAGIVTWTETGLAPNTQYSRSVSAYLTVSGSAVDSSRVALPLVYTLPNSPIFGSSGDGSVNCSRGQGSPSAWYPVGSGVTFTAVNGFGTGASRASKYFYVWDNSQSEPNWSEAQEWIGGTLTKAPSAGTYYLHLRACNGDGIPNPTALNLGPYIFRSTSSIGKIGQVWSVDNITPLSLSNKIVTASSAGMFWIEELDRSAALKVIYPTALTRGHAVNVHGTLLLPGQQRVLLAGSVDDLEESPESVRPVGMDLRSLGGSLFNADTPSITGGTGLYNLGLLVRVAGMVVSSSTSDPQGKYFVITDGGVVDGVKVLCGGFDPPSSGMVAVTGIIDTEVVGVKVVPVLIIRDAGDVLPL